MTVNDYCTYIHDNTRFYKSRLLVVPDKHNRQLLRAFYKNTTKAHIVRLSDCINESVFVPMENTVFARIKEAITEVNQNGKVAYVIGLDGYLSLLSSKGVSKAYELLRDIVDNQSFQVVFLAFELDIQSSNRTFANPRYKEGRTVMRLGDDNGNSNKQYAITFVGNAWLTHAHPYEVSIKSFLNKFEDEILADNEVRVAVEYNGYAFAGVNPSVHQVYSLESFMQVFYGIDQHLSDKALNWIHAKMIEGRVQTKALNFIQYYFYQQGLQDALITAPKSIREAQEAEQEVLIWMLKESIPVNTYLHKVLNNSNLNKSNFMMVYVCEALDLLTDYHASTYAEERRLALKEIGHENLEVFLNDFINQCKGKPIEQFAVWLNKGIEIEKI